MGCPLPREEGCLPGLRCLSQGRMWVLIKTSRQDFGGVGVLSFIEPVLDSYAAWSLAICCVITAG
jgi:hypothetical protein